MADLPEPPISADVDLRDFPYTPIYRARLFGSAFHARATDAEWRAGVTLWFKSQEQVPAGSLPDDDIELCRLAELGRDMKTWRRVKSGALHGWYRCRDGRLYHKVVTEITAEQWTVKLRKRHGTYCGTIRKWNQRHQDDQRHIPNFREWMSLGCPDYVQLDNTRVSHETYASVSHETTPACPVDVPSTSLEGPIFRNGREGNGMEGKGIDNSTLGFDSDSGSAPNGAAANSPPDDPVKAIFDRGLALLGSKSRSLLGKMRREHGDVAVLRAIVACEEEHPSDPAAFFVKVLAKSGGSVDKHPFTIGIG